MTTAFALTVPLTFSRPPTATNKRVHYMQMANTKTSARVYVGDAGKLAAAHVIRVAAAGASVAVSGGSLPKLLAAGLKEAGQTDLPTSWEHVLLADERVVPLDHEDSNYKLIAHHLGRAPIPIDPTLSTSECATDYEAKVTAALGDVPALDCALLGLGPDGHTCSLFPDHALLEEKNKVIAAIEDSPKPPPRRVTFTLSALTAAKNVAFVVTGSSKADVLKDILENPNSKYPGALVRPTSGNVTWFLDAGAASKLEPSTVTMTSAM